MDVFRKIYTRTITEASMAGSNNMITGLLVVVVLGALVYLIDPTFFGLLNSKSAFADMQEEEEESFTSGAPNAVSNGNAGPGQMANPGQVNLANDVGNQHAAGSDLKESAFPAPEGFADIGEGPANFGSAGAPAGCYPRDQLTPSELLPKDQNSVWAEQNPMGPGSLKGKNFLSAGALIGVNTVGQSLRNANLQLRSEPPNPQVPVSIFNQSTIAPDTNRRPLEIN